jgi:hypothetical protein
MEYIGCASYHDELVSDLAKNIEDSSNVSSQAPVLQLITPHRKFKTPLDDI